MKETFDYREPTTLPIIAWATTITNALVTMSKTATQLSMTAYSITQSPRVHGVLSNWDETTR